MIQVVAFLIGLVLLYSAGCESGDGQSETPDEDGVYVLSDIQGDTLTACAEWHEVPEIDCHWTYSVDTSFSIDVRASVPGNVHSARTWTKDCAGCEFVAGTYVYPQENEFRIEFYALSGDHSPADPQEISFYVEVVSGSDQVWLSPVQGVHVQVVDTTFQDSPPPSPRADSVYVRTSYYDQVVVEWCDRSPNEDAFVAYARETSSDSTFSATSPPDTCTTIILGLLPETEYEVWVTALNSYGESQPSNSIVIELPDTAGWPQPCIAGSALSVVLQWFNEDAVDLDLYVIEPSGEVCYFGNTPTTTGGTLLINNLCGNYQNGRPEVIAWEVSPAGHYVVDVDWWSECGNEVSSQAFQVYILCYEDTVAHVGGEIGSDDETMEALTFEVIAIP